jgi:hypothetical protein
VRLFVDRLVTALARAHLGGSISGEPRARPGDR